MIFVLKYGMRFVILFLFLILFSYFFNRNTKWKELSISFINNINTNFPNFQNIFTINNKKPIHENLLNECRTSFNKEKIDSTLHSRNDYTSYDNIAL